MNVLRNSLALVGAVCLLSTTVHAAAMCNGQPATKGSFRLSHEEMDANDWCITLDADIGPCTGDNVAEFVFCCHEFRLATDDTKCLVASACDKGEEVSIGSCSSGEETLFQDLGDYAEKFPGYKVHLQQCDDFSLDVGGSEKIGAPIGTYTSNGQKTGMFFSGDHLAAGNYCPEGLCENLDCGPRGTCNEVTGSCNCEIGYSGTLCNEGGEANCQDALQNGDETGPDCGGPDCDPCPEFSWVGTDWSECSKTCGGGVRTREVTCVDADGADQGDASCPQDEVHELKAEETCNDDACNTYTYTMPEWESCSVPCGGGTQTRTLGCVSSLGDSTVAVSFCESDSSSGDKPTESQSCNPDECDGPHWEVTWDTCSAGCGAGTQAGTIQCLTADKVESDDSVCDGTAKPDGTPKICNLGPCGQSTGSWAVCGWEECTATCGGSTVGGMVGVQSRTVRCMDVFDTTKVVDDFQCPPEYPGDTLLGCNADKCEGSNWMTTVWSSCDPTAKVRYRTTHCHDSKSRNVRDSVCDASKKPFLSEQCDPLGCPLQIESTELSMATRHHGLGVVATVLALSIAFTNAC